MPVGLGTAVTFGLAEGVTAGVIGGTLIGAAGGALLGGITGGDPGMGALFGGLTGGFTGGLGAEFAPAAGAASGAPSVGSVGADAASAGTAGTGAAAAAPVAGAAASAPVDLTSLASQAGGVGGAGAADFASPIAGIGSPAAAAGLSTGGDISGLAAQAGGAGAADFASPIASPGSPAAAAGLPTSAGGDVSGAVSLGGSGVASSPGSIPSTNALLNAPVGNVNAGQVGDFLKTGAAPTSATGAPSFSQGGSFLDNLASKAGTGAINQITKNPLGTAVSGIGLVNNLFNKPNDPNLGALTSQAQQLSSQGATMQQYLTTGTLPPGVQTGLDQATNAAKAAIKSKYANLGLSGSSMEQQDLNSLTLQAQTAGVNTAISLFDQGLNQTQISSQLYQELLNIDQQRSNATGSAIANFASSLNGGAATPTKQAA